MPRRRKRAQEEAPVSFFSFQDIICCVTGILVLITMLLSLDLINRSGVAGASKEGPFAALRQEIEAARQEQERLNKLLASAKASILEASANAAILPQDVPVLEERAKLAEQKAAKAKMTLDEKTSLRDQLQIELLGLASSSQTEAQRIAEIKKKIVQEKERPEVPAPGGVPSNLTPLYVEFSPSEVLVWHLSPTGKPVMLQRLAGYSAFMKWAGRRKTAEDFFVLMVKPDTVADFAKLRFDLRKLGFQVGWDAVLPDYSFLKLSDRSADKPADTSTDKPSDKKEGK